MAREVLRRRDRMGAAAEVVDKIVTIFGTLSALVLLFVARWLLKIESVDRKVAAALRDDLEEDRREAREQVEELSEELEGLQAEFQQLRTERDEAQRELEQLELRVDDLESFIENHPDVEKPPGAI